MTVRYAVQKVQKHKHFSLSNLILPLVVGVLTMGSILLSSIASAATVTWVGNGTTNGRCNNLSSDASLPAGTQQWLFILTSPEKDSSSWQLTTAFDLPSNPTNSTTSGDQQGGGSIHFLVSTPIGARLLSASATNGDDNSVLTVSHCEYHAQLQVTKTAQTSFTRDFGWTISKRNDQTNTVVLARGETLPVHYVIDVTKDSGHDGDWTVSGSIFVKNNDPFIAAENVSVTDAITDYAGTVDVHCPINSTITAGSTMECSYGPVSLTSSSSRLNTATATTTTSSIAGGSGTADVNFSDPMLIDNCVNVSDPMAPSGNGLPGYTCVSTAYAYTYEISADEEGCGSHDIVNVATLTEHDQTTTASSTVHVNVACVLGCTLTQGYWKTHNSLFNSGKHPDSTWNMLNGGLAAKTMFFTSGKTWYEMFSTAPAGNPYYILAHQYMAAKLNDLKGTTPDVKPMLLLAETLFTKYSPTDVAKLKGNDPIRAKFLAYALIFGAYNEGISGPGHCSE